MTTQTTNKEYNTKNTMSIRSWFFRLLSGKPHFVIGGADNPYLLRWFLIPRNHLLNIYLHKFMRSDDDRALHDHPWWFVSMILKGSYREILSEDSQLVVLRCRWSIAFRRATHRHRVELIDGASCWTLIITGRAVRTWGFWCPKGFVPWQQFTSPSDSGDIGRGCD